MAGFAAALLGILLGGFLEALFAWRLADSLDAAPIAGAILAFRIYDLPIPLTAGLAGSLATGVPAIVLLWARGMSAIKVPAIGGVLVIAGTAVFWVGTVLVTPIVAVMSLYGFCGKGSRGAISHYFYEFQPPQSIFRSFVAAIVFAVVLFAVHVMLFRRDTPDRKRRLRSVVLATVVTTLVAGGVLAVMRHDVYETLGITHSAMSRPATPQPSSAERGQCHGAQDGAGAGGQCGGGAVGGGVDQAEGGVGLDSGGRFGEVGVDFA